jgi:PTH1 family peptidyl-tRNA hydrolase
MKLIVGLGNPGEPYQGTRHNVGFRLIDVLAARHATALTLGPSNALQGRWRRGGAEADALLVKPLTFMNVSGEAVGALSRYFRVAVPDVLIVCDDVNLPLGRLRARARGSEGGHNGLRSIAQHLGTTEYARLRIGVGRGDARRDLADHVLAPFDGGERTDIDRAIDRAADAVEHWLDAGIEGVMNTYNRAEDTDAGDPARET